MSHFNGKQRDLLEWESLIKGADARLKIDKVVRPPGSHFAILEVVLANTIDTNGTNAVEVSQPVTSDTSAQEETSNEQPAPETITASAPNNETIDSAQENTNVNSTTAADIVASEELAEQEQITNSSAPAVDEPAPVIVEEKTPNPATEESSEKSEVAVEKVQEPEAQQGGNIEEPTNAPEPVDTKVEEQPNQTETPEVAIALEQPVLVETNKLPFVAVTPVSTEVGS